MEQKTFSSTLKITFKNTEKDNFSSDILTKLSDFLEFNDYEIIKLAYIERCFENIGNNLLECRYYDMRLESSVHDEYIENVKEIPSLVERFLRETKYNCYFTQVKYLNKN